MKSSVFKLGFLLKCSGKHILRKLVKIILSRCKLYRVYSMVYVCKSNTLPLFQLTQLLYNNLVYRIAGAVRSVATPVARGSRSGRLGRPASSVSHSGGDVCAVCMDETPNCVLVPCRHTCLCCTCAVTIRTSDNPSCPICRYNIDGINETH